MAMTTLFVKESGDLREATFEQVMTCAKSALSQRLRVGYPLMDQPEKVKTFLRFHLQPLSREVFGCLYLDSRHRLIAREDLFQGTIDTATVHPREVLRGCVVRGASGLILFHNHPSGLTRPSTADELVTRRLKDAVDLIDVRLLDHWIIGNSVFSFAEHGLL
jgi:DNA repair protein RadC